jgi:hypothetical protein
MRGKRRVTMDPRDSRTEELLAELEEEFFDRQAKGRRISRRELLRSSAGTAVVSTIGVGGLLELLANREAVAAGLVIGLIGVTREPNETDETPHRHGFVASFIARTVSPGGITGSVSGRTVTVISTGSNREDQHVHLIRMPSVSLQAVIDSGPENGMTGGHVHGVSIE